MSILFLGKQDVPGGNHAASYLESNFQDVTIVWGKRGDPLPPKAANWRGELIISYVSPWVVKPDLLWRARGAAINFHPGSPAYPGIGCTNFAIYDQVEEYGITCHHMLSSVDTGAIVDVKRFPVLPGDSVFDLTNRCYSYIYTSFIEVLAFYHRHNSLPSAAQEKWQRKPYRRTELETLCEIKEEMTEEEIRRRIKAVTFPGAPGAYILVGDQKIPWEKYQQSRSPK